MEIEKAFTKSKFHQNMRSQCLRRHKDLKKYGTIFISNYVQNADHACPESHALSKIRKSLFGRFSDVIVWENLFQNSIQEETQKIAFKPTSSK